MTFEHQEPVWPPQDSAFWLQLSHLQPLKKITWYASTESRVGVRPFIVISPNEMNKHLRTITIAPVTSRSKDYMTRVKFELEGNDNWIAIDQIRTVDITRIIKIIGELGTKEIKKVKLVIKEAFVD